LDYLFDVVHFSLEFNVDVFEFLSTHDFFEIRLFNSNVRNSDHDVLSVEIYSKKTSASKFNIEASYSTACFEEMAGVDEKMKGYKIAMK
jgi:hypothetical protein